MFLLPTDARLDGGAALDNQGVPLADLLQLLQEEKGRTIVLIVDACRNVVTQGQVEDVAGAGPATRGVSVVGAGWDPAGGAVGRLMRGRSRDIAAETPDVADYFVAFSTSPNRGAYDSGGEGSFSGILADEIVGGRHDLLSLFKSVAERMATVSRASGALQLPTYEVGVYHAPPCISVGGCSVSDPDRFYDCSGCPWMRVVAPAAETLGSPMDERGRGREEPAPYPFELKRRIAIGVYEVTRTEWRACEQAGACRSLTDRNTWQSPKAPVGGVTLADAQAYVAWLTKVSNVTYRLPSNEEWEFAARSGEKGRFPFGDRVEPSVAAYDYSAAFEGSPRAEYRGAPEPVGSFQANAIGLFDMGGNVWEWTQTCASGGACAFALRGESYKSAPAELRSANRFAIKPTDRREDVGLRVVRDYTR